MFPQQKINFKKYKVLTQYSNWVLHELFHSSPQGHVLPSSYFLLFMIFFHFHLHYFSLTSGIEWYFILIIFWKMRKGKNNRKSAYQCFSFFKKIHLFILKRDRESTSGKGRRTQRENLKQTMLSMEPHIWLDLMILRSWPEPKSRVRSFTNCATQASHFSYFNCNNDAVVLSWWNMKLS